MLGIITDANKIEEIIDGFTQPTTKGEKGYYQFSFNIYNHINLRESAGLHYYNQSVNFYNQQQIELALLNLEQAFELYPSPRLQEFKGLIRISASNR